MQSDPERRARGAQKLGEILEQTPDQVDRSLGDVAPQLATYVLETISGGTCPNGAPEEWAFLDTETTGLAGGSGTCAFLVG